MSPWKQPGELGQEHLADQLFHHGRGARATPDAVRGQEVEHRPGVPAVAQAELFFPVLGPLPVDERREGARSCEQGIELCARLAPAPLERLDPWKAVVLVPRPRGETRETQELRPLPGRI